MLGLARRDLGSRYGRWQPRASASVWRSDAEGLARACSSCTWGFESVVASSYRPRDGRHGCRPSLRSLARRRRSSCGSGRSCRACPVGTRYVRNQSVPAFLARLTGSDDIVNQVPLGTFRDRRAVPCLGLGCDDLQRCAVVAAQSVPSRSARSFWSSSWPDLVVGPLLRVGRSLGSHLCDVELWKSLRNVGRIGVARRLWSSALVLLSLPFHALSAREVAASWLPPHDRKPNRPRWGSCSSLAAMVLLRAQPQADPPDLVPVPVQVHRPLIRRRLIGMSAEHARDSASIGVAIWPMAHRDHHGAPRATRAGDAPDAVGRRGCGGDAASRAHDRDRQLARWGWCWSLCSPLVFGAVSIVQRGLPPGALFGDRAILGLTAGDAWRAPVLLGPYSRFYWHHPGPLYFYVLNVLGTVFGGGTVGFVLGAIAINIAAAAGILALAMRRGGSGAARVERAPA